MRRPVAAAVAGSALIPLLAGLLPGCVTRLPSAAAPAPGPAASAPAVSPPAAPSAASSAASRPAASPAMMPARLKPTAGVGKGAAPECLAQIEAFAERHSGNRVILGQAAFADSDELVLARMPHRGADGLPLDGRATLPQPVVLKLLSGSQGCVVRLAQAPSAEAALPACACAVEPAR